MASEAESIPLGRVKKLDTQNTNVLWEKSVDMFAGSPQGNIEVSPIATELATVKRIFAAEAPPLKDLLYDAELHEEVVSRYTDNLEDLRRLLDEDLREVGATGGDHLAMKHDSPEDVEARQKNKRDFHAKLRSARDKPQPTVVRMQEEPDRREMDETWKRSTSREELTKRFGMYLEKKPAKGKAQALREKSRKCYYISIFGLSTSFERVLKDTRGEGYEVHHLMFRGDNTHIPFDIQVVEEFLRKKDTRGSSSNLTGANGLHQLCNYFLRAAPLDPGYDSANPQQIIHYLEFKENIRQVLERLKEMTAVLSASASNEAAARKEDAAMADPTRDDAMREAIRAYYGSAHYKKYVEALHELAQVAEAGKQVDLAKMEDCARWLMLMVNYFNGARRQASSLLKNIHILRKQRSSTTAEQINLDNEALDLQDVASLTVDAHSHDAGKTGRLDLILPKSLSDSVVNLMAVKEAVFGPQRPEAPFFVSRSGEGIGRESLYLSNVAKAIWSEMGFRVTMTQNRAFIATRQRELNQQGKIITTI